MLVTVTYHESEWYDYSLTEESDGRIHSQLFLTESLRCTERCGKSFCLYNDLI